MIWVTATLELSAGAADNDGIFFRWPECSTISPSKTFGYHQWVPLNDPSDTKMRKRCKYDRARILCIRTWALRGPSPRPEPSNWTAWSSSNKCSRILKAFVKLTSPSRKAALLGLSGVQLAPYRTAPETKHSFCNMPWDLQTTRNFAHL